MTQSEQDSLSQQADRAAERVSAWPAWQQELVKQAGARPGTDAEPRVSGVAVAMVKAVLEEPRAEGR